MISSLSRPFIAVLAIVVGATAWAEPPRQDGYLYRNISVTGHGEASAKPDQAEVNAGVQTFAATVVEASQENQAVLARIMEALEEAGIADKDVQTANYNIWAQQDYEKEGKERITGYRVSNIVRIKVRDISRIGEVLAAVTNAGANSVNGIQFSVSDSDALEAAAREAAMADARAIAESLAALAGVELGQVLTISTANAPHMPMPMMASRAFEMADASAPAPGISPGQQSIGVQIHVTFAIR